MRTGSRKSKTTRFCSSALILPSSRATSRVTMCTTPTMLSSAADTHFFVGLNVTKRKNTRHERGEESTLTLLTPGLFCFVSCSLPIVLPGFVLFSEFTRFENKTPFPRANYEDKPSLVCIVLTPIPHHFTIPRTEVKVESQKPIVLIHLGFPNPNPLVLSTLFRVKRNELVPDRLLEKKSVISRDSFQ